ncbi:MAG: Fe-S cluster assembly ATPase SufC [Lachnospiraceae bacterium]|nr:Fe-S cluster assembly ATPase SufC [Lachnospiraceae bacterium]MBP3753784.1 Fe-S cluster assembly ATPase SufC [Lachnospiraceae bacterium]
MSQEFLNIKDLKVSIGDKEILKGLDLSIGEGETHVIMGPNGAGKSTLGNTLMGKEEYEVTSGDISFMGEDLLEMSTDERAKKGLFMTFQNPIEVPGVRLSEFTRSACEAVGNRMSLWNFKKAAQEQMKVISMDPSYLDRELNLGFSGGEKKKAEIFQLLMLKPKLAILDETDSGLDVDAVRIVSEGVKAYQEQTNGSLLIITHSTRILDSLKVDKVHVIVDGKVVAEGDASLISEINDNGFEKYLKA